MRLFIAEKPSVAKAIIAELGTVKRFNGYVECKGNICVTWCFGHLLEQAEPDYYLPEDVPTTPKGKKRWRMEDLPIFPDNWKLLPKNDKGVKNQLKIIKTLLSKADTVVNCGDPDREGQLLVDEILEFYRYRKPSLRFWASAQDSTSIKKALQSLKPNSQFKGMAQAALGRSRADWLIGMNLTRLFTLKHSTPSEKTLIAVGRVQTPTLALVAARDQLIKNFKPIPFYSFNAVITHEGINFSAQWEPKPDQQGLDAQKRLIDSSEAQKILSKLQSLGSGKVLSFTQLPKKALQPKPYSLADIQLDASNRYGFSAEETLNICQALYEKYKLASYPRSDCQYLPESQFSDAKAVLDAIAATNPNLAELVRQANPKIRSEAWNDKKISAHHGIIPTRQRTAVSELNPEEQKIYNLIAKRYICQFLPVHEYLETKIVLAFNGESFKSTGKTTKIEGWKAVYLKDQNSEEKTTLQNLPILQEGSSVEFKEIRAENKKTTPPNSFTEGTLISAMEKIHTVVKDPEFKKFLKETDGIGTPATRAAIISELKRKGYLEVKGKKIHATELGFRLLGLVPNSVKNPILTAMFERKLKEVESGKTDLDSFMAPLKKMIQDEIEKA